MAICIKVTYSKKLRLSAMRPPGRLNARYSTLQTEAQNLAVRDPRQAP